MINEATRNLLKSDKTRKVISQRGRMKGRDNSLKSIKHNIDYMTFQNKIFIFRSN